MIAAALLVALVGLAAVADGFIRFSPAQSPGDSVQSASPAPSATDALAGANLSPSPIATIPLGSGPLSTEVPASVMPSPTPTVLPSAGQTETPTLELTPSPTEAPTPDTDQTPSPAPGPTAEPITVVEVDQSDQSSCALASDARVYCWGSNWHGALGDGTEQDRSTADVPVVDIDDAVAIATGLRFACAIRSNRSVWCWGEDPGSDDNVTTPFQVSGIDDAKQISAGGQFACVLRRGGTVGCWGIGQLGQLGNGVWENNSGVASPQAVVGIDNAVQVSASYAHACALLETGRVKCWGASGNGQSGYGALGDGTFDNRNTPVDVVDLDGVTHIATGLWATCALRNDGTVWCWGNNAHGMLGNNSTENSPVPVQVEVIDDARRVTAGFGMACAERRNGSVWCWGEIRWGATDEDALTPAPGNGALDARQFAVERSLIVVDQDGVAWDWHFQFGDQPSARPVGPQ